MDRNSIIGIVLIVAILFGYTWYTMPSAEEQARMQRTQDSLASVELEKRAREAEAQLNAAATSSVQDTTTVRDTLSLEATLESALADSVRNTMLAKRYGTFHPAAQGTDSEVVIENERLQVAIRTHGARPTVIRLKEYQTYRKTPLLLADPDSGTYEFRFFQGNLDLSTSDLYFTAEQSSKDAVVLKAATTDPGTWLQITYRLDSAGYFMHVNTAFVGSGANVDVRSLFFRWELLGLHNEKHRETEQQKCGVYFKYFSDDRDYLKETGDDQKELVGRTNWVGFKQDFFTIGLVSEEGFAGSGSELAIATLADSTHTKRYSAKLFFEKERGAAPSVDMRIYMGPNHYGTLVDTEIAQFDKIIDLGWGIFGWLNKYLVIPIFNWLDGWGWSYGIIILVLTIVIKLLLMPLTWKNFVSSAKMRLLKPELDEINGKYKPEDALKKQQAQMDLYRKAGVNPANGCVPLLIQMPVLYAMFRFFPASIELRQQAFLWADDLSSYDSILDLPFVIPMYGDHISLFTLLMSASTIVYSLINQQQMPQQPGMPSMKLMIYLFPIMMLFFLNNFSAGLSYYYLLANVISILQMTLFKHLFVNEDKIRAQLVQNMKTPKKKSRWQQRLEDMQKQQQAARRK
ncbi:MAG: membrane protein insertase YidC [Flavobacteriales bacterium]|nr:membrane protein insertase YidC [Flavobacteriales bacterium]